MADQPTAPPSKPRKSRIAATLKALIRTRVTAGLLIVLPIWITFLLVTFVFGVMHDASAWVVEWFLHSERVADVLKNWLGFTEWKSLEVDELSNPVQWGISIASVMLTIFILYVIGLFTANIVGRRLIGTLELLVDRVPLVKTVYRSSKQILATFAGDTSQSFQRVALIPFPQEKMRCVGFITATFKDSITGEELATVFIPTTPNPTTGYLQILKRKDLVELDWSVEDAVRTIMSGGILRPDFLTIVPNHERESLPESASRPVQPPIDPGTARSE